MPKAKKKSKDSGKESKPGNKADRSYPDEGSDKSVKTPKAAKKTGKMSGDIC